MSTSEVPDILLMEYLKKIYMQLSQGINRHAIIIAH